MTVRPASIIGFFTHQKEKLLRSNLSISSTLLVMSLSPSVPTEAKLAKALIKHGLEAYITATISFCVIQ
jgi:hypothetical protein